MAPNGGRLSEYLGELVAIGGANCTFGVHGVASKLVVLAARMPAR